MNSKNGTGWRAKIDGITVGGKTGTAQVVRLDSSGAKDHAWFIAFAPAEDPMIAMSVVVENIGHGGEFAAPIAKAVMETYFRKKGMLTEPAEEQPQEQNAPDEEDTESTGIGE